MVSTCGLRTLYSVLHTLPVLSEVSLVITAAVTNAEAQSCCSPLWIANLAIVLRPHVQIIQCFA